MEDASGVDLDWFWRGWFYTTDHVDIAMEDIKWMQMDSQNPDVEAAFREASDARRLKTSPKMRNANGGVPQSYLEADPTLHDYLTTGKLLDQTLLTRGAAPCSPGKQYYEITFRNVGGLVMPLIVEFERRQ